jgi:hypothetical protein
MTSYTVSDKCQAKDPATCRVHGRKFLDDKVTNTLAALVHSEDKL